VHTPATLLGDAVPGVQFPTSFNTLVQCKAGKFSKTEMLKQIKRYKYDDETVAAIVIVTQHHFGTLRSAARQSTP
jgi:hypothetical protein